MKRTFQAILLGFLLLKPLCINAQTERAKWEFGGGLRFNYMGLDGGYEGEVYPNDENPYGNKFKLNYQNIGMDNYAPSMAIALGADIKNGTWPSQVHAVLIKENLLQTKL